MGKWKPTFAGLSPSVLREMLEDSSFDPAIYANIKSVYVGGDKAPLDLYALLKSKTGLSLREAMGMTECGGYLNCSPSMTPKPGSAGRPIPGTEIRIVDDEGKDVAQGTEGQLIVRTKAMMIGYWDEPEITAKTIRDDWLQTGDLGHVDEDGYYFITGRLKDVIVRGTGNVSPAEVEKAVTDHPDVVQCCVFGIPDGDMGEAVVAAIVPTDLASAPTKTALTDFVTQRLAERKIPSHWLFFNELPVTDGMGKVDRATLKKMGLEQLGK
jgi:long-chain acyl-CoA synthetase